MKRWGFTLVELLLVTAMILIMGLASVPFYARFFVLNSAATTADKVVQLTRKAQFYAMTSRKNNSSGWGIYYSAPTITLYQGSSYSAGGRDTTWDETYNVVSTVTISGLTEINFARLSGSPTPTSATITISGNQGSSETLTMNGQGMITR